MKTQRESSAFSCLSKGSIISFCFLLGLGALPAADKNTRLQALGDSRRTQGAARSALTSGLPAPRAFAAPDAAGGPSTPTEPGQPSQARVIEAYGKLPLSFEPNQGQTDSEVKYLSRGRGYILFLTPNEAVLSFRRPANTRPPTALHIKLVSSNSTPRLVGLEELSGKSNYFIGNNPAAWHTNIPNYRKVAVQDVYPGIDLIYYGKAGQLEYDFVLHPGADPRSIKLAFDGAKKLRTNANGDLVVIVAGGELCLRQPVVYQEATNAIHTIPGRFVLRGSREVGFRVARYDSSRPLVIDPVLSYSTYFGGSDIDAANSIAVDSTGSAFVAGETDSIDFPTAHPLQPNAGGPRDFPDDAFVSKISADGQTLVYSTYLGGSRTDKATAIAVDSFGAAYVTGTTLSEDFPATIGAADPNCGFDAHCDATTNGGLIKSDAFITKLNPEGSALEYSTYFGHDGPVLLDSLGNPVIVNGVIQHKGANDLGFGIAVDQNGIAYVTGATDFATPAFLVGGGGDFDGFIVKVSATGSSFLMVADFGGIAEDQGLAIAADNSGTAYVSGLTFSPDFPVTISAFQSLFGGNSDAFVLKFNTILGVPGGLAYSTFLGGNGNDQCKSIATDGSGKVYVTGVTSSTAPPFPTTAGVFQTTCALNTQGGCDGDTFVAKLDTTQSGASSLVYSTYLGGTAADSGAGIGIDSSGNAYITGFTNSTDFPVTPQIPQPTFGGGNGDAFVTKLNPTATALVFSTYLGGSNTEDGRGIAVDISGSSFVAGQTCSIDFPLARPLQGVPAGKCDAFVSKVSVAAGPLIGLTPSSLTFAAQSVGTMSAVQMITVVSNGSSPLTISNVTIGGDFAQTNNCPVSPSTLAVGASCPVNVTFTPSTSGTRTGTLTFTDDAVNSPQIVNLNGSGIVPVVSVSTTSLSFGNTLVGIASASQTVTLTNTGNAGILTIIEIDATGQFAQNNNCGNSLAAGASCTITVTFLPTAAGTQTGTLSIVDNAANSPQTVSLTGHGTAPIVRLSPSNLAFGNQGTTGPAQTVTLSNLGDGALTTSAVSISASFAQTNTCGSSVAPGASCTFSVTFNPTASGAVTGQLSVTDNAAGSPQTVSLSGTGVIPVVSLSPASLTFDNQPVGMTSIPQTVILSNTGTALLNISSIVVTGDFAQTSTCGTSVAAGGNCFISVTFRPTATGTRTGAVTITDSAPGSPHVVSLTGTGVPSPTVTLSATSLSFGNQPVGTTSAPQTIIVTNTGAAPLNILNVVASGDFAQTNNCIAAVPPATNCAINVTFTPTATGASTGAVTITDNAPGSPHVVSLTGNGTAPVVSLSATSLSFANQPVDAKSAPQTVTMSNTGGAPLNISSIVASGDFAQTNSCGSSVVPGGNCSLSVTFTPTTTGTRNGAVTITDNAAGSPQVISLTGTGVPAPAVSLSTATLSFPNQPLGTASAAELVTLTNTGGATLTITSIVVSGDFTQTNTCGLSVAAGNSCTISISFSPSAGGPRSGTLTITDNAPLSPQVVALSGDGTDFSVSANPHTATVTAGQLGDFIFTVTPLFGFNTKIELSCSGAPGAASCLVSPASVTLNGTTPSISTATVTTTVRSKVGPGRAPNLNLPGLGKRPGLPWLPWILAFAMLASLAAAGRRRTWLCLGVTILFVSLWAACAGGSQFGVPSGTPTGTYTLTLTGTSGALTRTTTVTLTVN